MGVENLFEGEPGWTNRMRAEMAAKAAYEYAERGKEPERVRPSIIDPVEVTPDDIIDLMTDLYHLAHLLGLDVRQLSQTVQEHFLEEQNDERSDAKEIS